MITELLLLGVFGGVVLGLVWPSALRLLLRDAALKVLTCELTAAVIHSVNGVTSLIDCISKFCRLVGEMGVSTSYKEELGSLLATEISRSLAVNSSI